MIHIYLTAESEAKVVYREPIFVIDEYNFMTVFNRRERVEDHCTSECIRTVAATYGCKILQLYEYEANGYGYQAKCE